MKTRIRIGPKTRWWFGWQGIELGQILTRTGKSATTILRLNYYPFALTRVWAQIAISARPRPFPSVSTILNADSFCHPSRMSKKPGDAKRYCFQRKMGVAKPMIIDRIIACLPLVHQYVPKDALRTNSYDSVTEL
jgi:hypothetical protein